MVRSEDLYTVTLSADTKSKLLEILKSSDKFDKTKQGKIYTESDYETLIEEIVCDEYARKYYD